MGENYSEHRCTRRGVSVGKLRLESLSCMELEEACYKYNSEIQAPQGWGDLRPNLQMKWQLMQPPGRQWNR